MGHSQLHDAIYQQVGEELGRKELHPGPMARAVAESNGNRELVDGLYIRFRFDELCRQTKGFVACQNCGFVGKPMKQPRGNTSLLILLYFLFIVPGLIYGIAFSGYRSTCSQCGKRLAD